MKLLLLVQLGEGALVRTVEEAVQNRGHKTAADENNPDQTVVVIGQEQNTTDQILGQGGEK